MASQSKAWDPFDGAEVAPANGRGMVDRISALHGTHCAVSSGSSVNPARRCQVLPAVDRDNNRIIALRAA